MNLRAVRAIYLFEMSRTARTLRDTARSGTSPMSGMTTRAVSRINARSPRRRS